jgi:uncharacterized protein (TIGR00251 family)
MPVAKRDANAPSDFQVGAIECRVAGDGILLPVKAQPGARRNAIVGEHAGRLKVAVTQVAEKGRANEAICEVIAGSLGVSSGQVSVMTGATSSLKTVRIEDCDQKQFCDWLEGILRKPKT